MAGKGPSWPAIVVTAFLTALGTSLASDWLPGAVEHLYDQLTEQPILVVYIQKERDRQPVENVVVSVSALITGEVIDTEETDEKGIVRLEGVPTGRVFVEAKLDEGTTQRIYAEVHDIPELPHDVKLDPDTELWSRKVLIASISPGSQASSVGVPPGPLVVRLENLQYGQPLLPQNRQQQAVLEIDWVSDTPRLPRAVTTRDGELRLEDVLSKVGIDLRIEWSTELPRDAMGVDDAFSKEELKNIMQKNRNSYPDDLWHFYLVYGGRHENEGILSFLFDSDTRAGSVLFSPETRPESRQVFYEVIHALGHAMNLPHPWQAYGDTRSVMSYPYRWPDWDWDDPTVYHYDEFGTAHIRRAPEDYVRPGRGAFFEYGGLTPWAAIASKS